MDSRDPSRLGLDLEVIREVNFETRNYVESEIAV